LFLKRETFFNWNRTYLLVTAALSISLPFIKLNSFKTVIPKEYIANVPKAVIESLNKVQTSTSDNLEAVDSTSMFVLSWDLIMYLGSFVTALLFIYKLVSILRIIYKNQSVKLKEITIVELQNSKSAFSFFNYIFIGDNIKAKERTLVIAHEEVHAKDKHSLDLLFFEILRILFWFNPLVYLYQNKVASLHEYIADTKAAKMNKVDYSENLLSQIFQTKNVSFINLFFKESLIKKRIIMLNKTKSKKVNKIKYLLLIPIVIGMLSYTSCEKEVEKETTDFNKNDTELFEKYIVEIEGKQKEGAKLFDLLSQYSKMTENYIIEQESFEKSKAWNYLFNIGLVDEDSISDEEKEAEKLKLKQNALNDTYSAYIEKSKTKEGRLDWELSMEKGGVLRKVVDNLDAITEDEQKVIDQKLARIKRNEDDKMLIIADDFKYKRIGSI
jgi:beta-lactamase regulating signal transducer with metallopeptidase domain